MPTLQPLPITTENQPAMAMPEAAPSPHLYLVAEMGSTAVGQTVSFELETDMGQERRMQLEQRREALEQQRIDAFLGNLSEQAQQAGLSDVYERLAPAGLEDAVYNANGPVVFEDLFGQLARRSPQARQIDPKKAAARLESVVAADRGYESVEAMREAALQNKIVTDERYKDPAVIKKVRDRQEAQRYVEATATMAYVADQQVKDQIRFMERSRKHENASAEDDDEALAA